MKISAIAANSEVHGDGTIMSVMPKREVSGVHGGFTTQMLLLAPYNVILKATSGALDAGDKLAVSIKNPSRTLETGNSIIFKGSLYHYNSKGYDNTLVNIGEKDWQFDDGGEKEASTENSETADLVNEVFNGTEGETKATPTTPPAPAPTTPKTLTTEDKDAIWRLKDAYMIVENATSMSGNVVASMVNSGLLKDPLEIPSILELLVKIFSMNTKVQAKKLSTMPDEEISEDFIVSAIKELTKKFTA